MAKTTAPATNTAASTAPPPAPTPGDIKYSATGTPTSGAGDSTNFPPFDSGLATTSWDNVPGKSSTFTAQNPNFQAVGSLLGILRNLESGKPLSDGTDAATLTEVLNAAGISGGAQGTAPQRSNQEGEFGQILTGAERFADTTLRNLERNPLQSNVATAPNDVYPTTNVVTSANGVRPNTPEYRKLENVVQTSIEKHLKQAGIPTDTLGAHPTADQISQLSVSPVTKQRLSAEGYDLTSVNTLGTLVETLNSAPPKPETIPGATTSMTAQMYYDTFQQNWNNPAYQTEISGQLAQAGLLDTAAPTKAQAGTKFLEMLKLASEANLTPDAYLAKAQSATQQGIGTQLPANDEYVQSIGNQFGVHLSPAQVNALSAANPNASSAPGSSDTGLRAQVAGLYLQNFDPSTGPTGYASVISAAMDQYAGAYAVPLTESAKQDQIQKILLAGNFTSSYEANLQGTTAAENYMKMQAQSLYPAYASQINQGMTMKDIAAPYLQTAQDTLGVNASALNLTDPKWSKVFEGNADGSPVSLGDWRSYLMTNPTFGWSKTQNARDIGSDISAAFAQEFGLAGGGQNPTSASVQGL
jgi:hypothetical protein